MIKLYTIQFSHEEVCMHVSTGVNTRHAEFYHDDEVYIHVRSTSFARSLSMGVYIPLHDKIIYLQLCTPSW